MRNYCWENKKKLELAIVERMSCMKRYWWGMIVSTTNHIIDYKFKLLRVWEPSDSLGHILVSNGKRPNSVFFIETKIKICKFDYLKENHGFDSYFLVIATDRRSDLALFLIMEMNFEVDSYSQSYINTWMIDKDVNLKWLFTGFLLFFNLVLAKGRRIETFIFSQTLWL